MKHSKLPTCYVNTVEFDMTQDELGRSNAELAVYEEKKKGGSRDPTDKNEARMAGWGHLVRAQQRSIHSILVNNMSLDDSKPDPFGQEEQELLSNWRQELLAQARSTVPLELTLYWISSKPTSLMTLW